MLGAKEGALDLLDRVARVDRRLQHAIAQLRGQVGVERPYRFRRAFREAAPEIEIVYRALAQVTAP